MLLAETAFDDNGAEEITRVTQGLASPLELEVDTCVVANRLVIVMYAHALWLDP